MHPITEKSLFCPGAVTFCAEEFPKYGKMGLLRREFELHQPEKLSVFIAGMAGYQLSLDGKLYHCGPEWSYDNILIADEIILELSAGKHIVEIKLWNHGLEYSALREMSHHAFFALWSENDSPAARELATDQAEYQCCILSGWQICSYHMSCMAGPRLEVDFRVPPSDWQRAVKLDPKFMSQHNYRFYKRMLPLDYNQIYTNITLRSADHSVVPTAVFHENIAPDLAATAMDMIQGRSVTIPRGKNLRFVFDLNNYICARASFKLRGGCGGRMEVMLTESLFNTSDNWIACYGNPDKGNRNIIDGKYAVGRGDRFTAGCGEYNCQVLDWDAGRYLVIYINSTNEPMTVSDFVLTQTHSGIKLTNPIKFTDPTLNQIADISLNSLKNCMHTTYMDCPHYEQLMYVGDGRLEALINYVTAPGCLMQRKALKAFAASIRENGFTQTRYPSHERSEIPGFSLFFINTLHDYAMWSSDKALITELLPACRTVIAAFQPYLDEHGLYRNPDSWNFYDWVPTWERGVPPTNGEAGALMNLHMATVLQDMADLEEYADHAENAPSLRERAEQLKKTVHENFFIPEKGLYSCDLQHLHYSQHVQAMALLAGLGDRTLYEKIFDGSQELAKCTIYFSHYLFEAAKRFGDSRHPLVMLDFWKALPDQGLFTTPERPEPARSDCHAWGGHVLYYFVTGLAGVRPAAMGGKEFVFAPAAAEGVPDFELDLPLSCGRIKVAKKAGKFTVEASEKITIHNKQNQ